MLPRWSVVAPALCQPRSSPFNIIKGVRGPHQYPWPSYVFLQKSKRKRGEDIKTWDQYPPIPPQYPAIPTNTPSNTHQYHEGNQANTHQDPSQGTTYAALPASKSVANTAQSHENQARATPRKTRPRTAINEPGGGHMRLCRRQKVWAKPWKPGVHFRLRPLFYGLISP